MVYKKLYEHFRPRRTVDLFSGSGTALDVAREMGIEAVGLDLCHGFNALKDSVLAAVGEPVALATSHPPYNTVVTFSGVVWGEQPHPDDLSRCANVEEYLAKLQLCVLNLREATARGGHYVVIIGDQRQHGAYYSFQADLIASLPRDELRSVCVKLQHHTQSSRRQYVGLKYPAIGHEYVIIWERPTRPMALVDTLAVLARRFQSDLRSTWSNIVRLAVVELGGQAALQDIYTKVEGDAGERVKLNPHWKEKVRQVLQVHPELFAAVERGEWRLAA